MIYCNESVKQLKFQLIQVGIYLMDKVKFQNIEIITLRFNIVWKLKAYIVKVFNKLSYKYDMT